MRLENRILIEAPRDTVWALTEDVERWPDWTPTVTAAKRLDNGSFEVGSTVLLKQPGLPQAEWRLTSLRRGEEFTWETKVVGLRMVATHELETVGAQTACLLRIQLSGTVVALLGPLIRMSVGRALQTENEGLKAASEALARSSE